MIGNMGRMTRVGLSALVLLLASGGAARAGQLHIEHFGLKEVREEGATIVVGSVTATAKQGRKRTVTLTVTKLFVAAGGGRGFNEGKPAGVGESITRELYAGVEWTDPHKSPMDHRLRGALHDTPAIGASVILVPSRRSGFELLAAEETPLRTLAILWGPDAKAALAKETPERLAEDLKNPDLAELARVELGKRGKLSASLLLRGDERYVSDHYRKLSPDRRAAFLREVLPATKRDRDLRLRAAKVALDELEPQTLAPVALLVAQLDWKDADEAEELEQLRVPLLTVADPETRRGRRVDLSAFEDYLVQSTLRRPDHRSNDEDLEKLAALCDKPTRARLAVKFLAAVYGTSRAKDDDPDDFLLGTAAELARAAPSVALWEPLTKLDPNRPRVTSTKSQILDAMADIGASLAKHDPRFKAKVRDLLEPHLVSGELTISDETKQRYDKIIGVLKRGAPQAATVELKAGQTRRLANGDRVTVKASKEGNDLEVELAQPGGQSDSRFLETGKDRYREWWIDGYLVIVHAAGAGVRLTLTPMKKDKALEPSDAFALARKVCDKRGATGQVEQDNQDGDGLYTYEVKEPKPCVVRVGLRTRKVLPEAP